MTRLYTILGAIAAFVAMLFGARLSGARAAKTAQKLDTLEKDVKAHDRINKVAPAGNDDADNRKRLRDAAQQLGD